MYQISFQSVFIGSFSGTKAYTLVQILYIVELINVRLCVHFKTFSNV